jgi:Sigma-70 region 2
MQLGVPGYLPALVHPVVPWARRHVARVAARYVVSINDLWDEAVTALLRATVSYKPGTGAFPPYARTAVHRACARAVNVGQHRRRSRLWTVAFEETGERLELTAPSAEAEAIAREAVRRAWMLREHAALAAAHGDIETTTRLRDAATAAATAARAVRRRRQTSGA